MSNMFTSGSLADRLEAIAQKALVKFCQSISEQAKAGTLPESLKPFSPILEFLAEAAEDAFTPTPNP
ncbi:MAG: hypothetical protein V4719_10175 [Planctomycetota bacterium]